MGLCWSTRNSSCTIMKKISSSKSTTFWCTYLLWCSIRWLRGPFRWSQFYNNNKPNLHLVYKATTQAIGLLILVFFLCTTALGEKNSTFSWPQQSSKPQASHADQKQGLMSAQAPIHIWDYKKQKPCLRYITEIHLKTEQAWRVCEASEEAVTKLNYGPVCFRNIGLNLQSKPERTALGTLTQER